MIAVELDPLKWYAELGFAIGTAGLFVLAALWALRAFINRSMERETQLAGKLDGLEKDFRGALLSTLEKNQMALGNATAALERFGTAVQELTETLKTKPCLLTNKEVLSRLGITA